MAARETEALGDPVMTQGHPAGKWWQRYMRRPKSREFNLLGSPEGGQGPHEYPGRTNVPGQGRGVLQGLADFACRKYVSAVPGLHVLPAEKNGSWSPIASGQRQPHASRGTAAARALRIPNSSSEQAMQAERAVTSYGSCLMPCHLGVIKWFPTVIEAAHKIFLN